MDARIELRWLVSIETEREAFIAGRNKESPTLQFRCAELNSQGYAWSEWEDVPFVLAKLAPHGAEGE